MAGNKRADSFWASEQIFPRYAIGYKPFAISSSFTPISDLLCIAKDEKPMVTVLVFGLTLRDAVGETEFELEVSEPTTVRKLIESNQDCMGPLVQFLANREVLIAVNKKVSAEDTVVKDGDIVKLSHQSRTSYDGTRDIPI
jgi:sulfur-carrier protein